MQNDHANASTHVVSGHCLMLDVLIFANRKGRDWTRLGHLVFNIR